MISDNMSFDINKLKQLFVNNKLAQSYIFYGSNYEIIKNSAIELSEFVLSKSEQNPHGFDLNLTKKFLAQNTHPNFFILSPESEGKEIVVENARNLTNFLQSTPTIPGWRFVLIDPADSLNNASSNAILKNMEELPNKTTIVMIASGLSKIKPTILSRSQKIFFKSKIENVKDYINSEPLSNTVLKMVESSINGKIPTDTEINEIVSNNNLMKIFKNLVLTIIYEYSLERFEQNQQYLKKYEIILNFFNEAENKSLSPVNFVRAVFLKISE